MLGNTGEGKHQGFIVNSRRSPAPSGGGIYFLFFIFFPEMTA